MYALIAPFLPLELEQKGVSMTMSGYIFSMYSLAMIICSPLIGFLLTKYKLRGFVRLGILSMGFSMILFAFLNKIENKTLYVTLVFATRFIQGSASATIQTCWFTVSGRIYKEHQSVVISLLEIGAGVGMTIGPVVGSILFEFGGYKAPFLTFGFIFVAFGCILNKFMPASIDDKDEANESLISSESEEQNLKFTDLIKRPTIFLACCAGGMGYFNYAEIGPILALHLKE